MTGQKTGQDGVMLRCPDCMKTYMLPKGIIATGYNCPYCGYIRGSAPKEPFQLYPETILNGRYIIGTVISYGGFGIVYKAWDPVLDAMIAIKEYFPTAFVSRNPGELYVFVYNLKRRNDFIKGRTGFLNEARITAKFSKYETIVNVYDFFEENGTAYMVMEYMHGKSLKEILKEHGGRIPWQQAVSIATSVMDALKLVHSLKILHRDLSPDNIFIMKDGRLKLFDFGAARYGNNDEEMKRTIILKVGFSPPEQYLKKSRQDQRTDIYALGGTIYRAITGRMPPESMKREEALAQRKADPLIPIRAKVPDVPEYLDLAIQRSMALRMEARFPNCDAFKDAVLNKKPPKSVERVLKELRWRRRILVVCLFAVIALTLFFSVNIFSEQIKEKQLDAEITFWYPVPVDSTKDGMSENQRSEHSEQAKQSEKSTESEESTVSEKSEQSEKLEGSEESEQSGELTVYGVGFSEAVSLFQEDYPKARVKIEAIPRDIYDDRLLEALDEGRLPTLFDSTGLSEKLENQMEKLSVYDEIDSAFYSLLNPELRDNGWYQLPLGFHAMMLYWNRDLLNDPNADFSENNQKEFLLKKRPAMLSDEGMYEEVVSKLGGPGHYGACIPEETVISFSYCLSINKSADKIEKKAADVFLAYLISETVQRSMFSQAIEPFPLFSTALSERCEGYDPGIDLSTVPEDQVTVVKAEDFYSKCDENFLKLFGADNRDNTLDTLIDK